MLLLSVPDLCLTLDRATKMILAFNEFLGPLVESPISDNSGFSIIYHDLSFWFTQIQNGNLFKNITKVNAE